MVVEGSLVSDGVVNTFSESVMLSSWPPQGLQLVDPVAKESLLSGLKS